MKETKENRIDAVRAFLAAANKQFEAQGIRLERVIFKRDEDGKLSGAGSHTRTRTLTMKRQRRTGNEDGQRQTPETVLAQNPLKPTQQERGTEGKGQTLSEA